MTSSTAATIDGGTSQRNPAIGFSRPHLHHSHSRSKSADMSAETVMGTDISCASSVTSTTSASTFDTEGMTLYSTQLQPLPVSRMTTYYLYDDGKLVGTSNIDPAAQAVRVTRSPDEYERRGDVVGAYLARRAMAYPAQYTSSVYRQPEPSRGSNDQGNEDQEDQKNSEEGHWPEQNDDSQDPVPTFFPEHARLAGYMGHNAHPDHDHPCPDPELIRHQYSLHKLLPHIDPKRRLHACDGTRIDVVEQDTCVMLADGIPKKLLILFLGRKVVNKFIRTTQRADSVNWRGPATQQILKLPRGRTSRVAMKVLVTWMFRACHRSKMGSIEAIKIPDNMFAACSLAQTMELLELRRDAHRVDSFISRNHFARPIFPVELEALWNCMGEGSKFVYAAIKAVGGHLRDMEARSETRMPWVDEMETLLEKHPRMKARVYDVELNAQYQPVFGTRWMYVERN